MFGVILICIFSAFFLIRIEYGEIRNIFPYSVQILENAGNIQTRITPNMNTFYAVLHINIAKKNTEKNKKILTKTLFPLLQYMHVSILILFAYFGQCYLFIVTIIFFLEADIIKIYAIA